MFELKLFNPISSQMETVLALSDVSEAEALLKARDFLFQHGVKFGELVAEGEPRGKNVFGFEDEPSVADQGGGFGFLPSSPIYHVFKHIRDVLDTDIRSFIDLGCGPGNILMSAHRLLGATRLTGVEIDSGLVARARENTAQFDAAIIEADLMEWEPEINEFDMIYMYEPIRDEAKRLRFLAHLSTWLNEGQHVFYQHAVGKVPAWFTPVDLAPYRHPCLYTFDGNKT